MMRSLLSPFLAGASITSIAGCVTEPVARRPMPPRPAETRVESISISVGFAEDTDLNGFVDSFDVTALLFDSRHPLPVTVEGEFIFRLTSSREQKSLAEWRVPPEAVAAAIRLLPPGPGYAFRLDLNKAQGDRVDRQQADLTCSFIPTGGEEVKSRGGATMRVGSVNR